MRAVVSNFKQQCIRSSSLIHMNSAQPGKPVVPPSSHVAA